MIKLIAGLLFVSAFTGIQVPEVKVAGAMKNIMLKGDLSAHLHLDTLNKTNLYGLGPVSGLKGEIIVLDGNVYTTSVDGTGLNSKENKIADAAMLVYSYVPKWKALTIETSIATYTELEKFIERTAAATGYDTDKPFPFKIEAKPEKTSYHVIDWKDGITHTMDNHKQFAYTAVWANSPVKMLGFYSKHHQSIFTHHTSFMHVHVMDDSTKTIGHLDQLQLKGLITVYLPER